MLNLRPNNFCIVVLGGVRSAQMSVSFSACIEQCSLHQTTHIVLSNEFNQ